MDVGHARGALSTRSEVRPRAEGAAAGDRELRSAEGTTVAGGRGRRDRAGAGVVTWRLTSVLITGFGPFPGAPFNPTEPLARAVASGGGPAFADMQRTSHVFETSYAAVDRELPALITQHKPDVAAHVRARRAHAASADRNAGAQRASILFPDVTGVSPRRAHRSHATAPRQRGTRPFAAADRGRGRAAASGAPFARCRPLFLQLRLLARARGDPNRHAARAVHAYPVVPTCRGGAARGEAHDHADARARRARRSCSR